MYYEDKKLYTLLKKLNKAVYFDPADVQVIQTNKYHHQHKNMKSQDFLKACDQEAFTDFLLQDKKF